MPDHLIILLGAGASYDCASELVLRDGTWRPPLTSHLFDQRFQPTLNNYPMAEAAASDIQPILAREQNPVPLVGHPDEDWPPDGGDRVNGHRHLLGRARRRDVSALAVMAAAPSGEVGVVSFRDPTEPTETRIRP